MSPLPTQVQKLSDETDALVEEVKKAKKTDKKKAKEEVKEEVEVKTDSKPLAKEPEHREPEAKEKEEDWAHWKHKYEVLQGRYNKDIEPIKDDVNALINLKSHVKHLNRRVQEGDALVRDLQAKLKEKESAPPPKKMEMPESVLSLLSDEDRSHFEEEGIDNKSIEIFGKLIQELTARNQPSNYQSIDIEALRQEARLSKENRVNDFWEKVSDAVSDWAEINTSVDFLDWLDVPIPYTNITRQEALKSAGDVLDHKAVIDIFTDFKKGRSAPEPKPKPLEVDLDEHLEPKSTVGSEEPKSTPGAKTYTVDEIVKFYDDVARRKITDQKEIDRIDADIIKAPSEGRVTN
jgi:hypothetical protein